MGFKVKPTLDYLRVFVSRGYAHIDKAKRTKLEPKCFRCLLLGYPENDKGYRVYDLDASKVKVSRSVKLDEREVDGIYDTQPAQNGTFIHVTTDADDAVTLARDADAVVCVIGTNMDWEAESSDRKGLDLPGLTDELVRRLLDANQSTVVVNQSVRFFSVPT